VVALSKFGTFTDLQVTHSAKNDGDIATFSFYGATYTSPFLHFTAETLYTNQPAGDYYTPLETLDNSQQVLWAVNDGGRESFPFLDLAGKYVFLSGQFDSSILLGHSFNTILDETGDNTKPIGDEVDASAAALIRYFCTVDGNQPSDVCSAVSG
jgi:hypothetical protein